MVREAQYHYTSHLYTLLCLTAPFVTWRLHSYLNPKGIPGLVYYMSRDYQKEYIVTQKFHDKKETIEMQSIPYKGK